MKTYQRSYAATKSQMYDQRSRVQKAIRMIKTLEDYLGKDNLSKLSLLDIGSSTGIITNSLAPFFKKVVGIDIDKGAIEYAKKTFQRGNLTFEQGDSMKLKFASYSFDVVICAQIYEHVPDPQKLFQEIYRVLKPGGVCYLAAVNKFWPIEPHYNLPFLSFLPKALANYYVRLTSKGNSYYETLLSYWQLKNLTKDFIRNEYTEKILKNPSEFGYNIPNLGIFSYLGKYFAPTLFWILVKPDSKNTKFFSRSRSSKPSPTNVGYY